MCLALICIQSHPLFKLIIAGNRDEFYERPTAPAAFWNEFPNLLAGRDLLAGGTWFGITRQGKIAAITNYRNPALQRDDAPSRGRIVLDYLISEKGPVDYLNRLVKTGRQYNGFNLLAGEIDEVYWYSNMDGPPRLLSSGIYGLSNQFLDTPWPKVNRSKKAFQKLLAENEHPQPEDFFSILSDRSVPPDEALPDTGVGIERERILSPIFISSPDYGTRSSFVFLVDHRHGATFWERTFKNGRNGPLTVKFQCRLDPTKPP